MLVSGLTSLCTHPKSVFLSPTNGRSILPVQRVLWFQDNKRELGIETADPIWGREHCCRKMKGNVTDSLPNVIPCRAPGDSGILCPIPPHTYHDQCGTSDAIHPPRPRPLPNTIYLQSLPASVCKRLRDSFRSWKPVGEHLCDDCSSIRSGAAVLRSSLRDRQQGRRKSLGLTWTDTFRAVYCQDQMRFLS